MTKISILWILPILVIATFALMIVLRDRHERSQLNGYIPYSETVHSEIKPTDTLTSAQDRP